NLTLGGVTMLEIGAQAAGIVFNCVWAVFSPSVWALMSGSIVNNLLRMAFSHLLNRGTGDRFAWDRDAFRELVTFGRWIFLSTVRFFCAAQGARILLSKLLSFEALGVYSLAAPVALLPNVLLGTMSSSVLSPLLCQAERIGRSELQSRLLAARGWLLSCGV